MPLRLEIKKELTARSDRVKSVELHPSEPWVLSALYNGNVFIWDYFTNTLVKSFEMCEVPVRCAKFVVRKQWIVAATDDMHLRVYNYNTMEKVKEFEAHTDYIRFVEVHPNRPVILSSSDDMSIKLWDWEKNFDCIQIYEGHAHYVMMVKINPRDTNTFASASLDRTIKVWGLSANTPHYSLSEGPGAHERGVNCIDYYPGGDKPYLLSGADDHSIKIWDYQTRACLQTLEGHSHNVSAVCFHPRLPLIVSASEDGTVRLWHSTTYRPESTLNYGMERAWTLAPTHDANKLAIGYDEGTIVLKLGNERPVASLDTNSGKLVWAKHHDIQTMSIKGLSKTEVADGEKLTLSARDLGACEVYPQSIQHNRNGQFIVVLGDGEYIIYTSQALRNKGFGTALDFVWSSQGSGDYAVRENISRVKIFKNFKEHKQVSLSQSSAEGIYGGNCLAVRGPDCIIFYDWDEGELLRKIDVVPRNIYWNEAGDMVVLACEDTYFILKYDAEVVAAAVGSGSNRDDSGVEGSFELEHSGNDKVRTGQWVGDCFLFTNTAGRLNYFVGGQVMTLCHMDHPMYLLGFVPKEDRVFLIDKAYNVISHKVLLSVLNYQTAVVRQDFETANAILPTIPRSEYSAVARFLESQGFKDEALAVSPDLEHRFELAIDLRNLIVAHSVLVEFDGTADEQEQDSTDYQNKWKRLGDLALSQGNVDLAQTCAERSGDLSGQLLLYAATGNRDGVCDLAERARKSGRSNVAFLAFFVTGQMENCIQLLVDTKRIPEAVFMARTYMPSMISSVLELWKADLKTINEKAAEALADPEKYPNLFPDLQWALKVEEFFKTARNNFVPASSYLSSKDDLDLKLIDIIKMQASSAQQETSTSNADSLTTSDVPCTENQSHASLTEDQTADELPVSSEDYKSDLVVKDTEEAPVDDDHNDDDLGDDNDEEDQGSGDIAGEDDVTEEDDVEDDSAEDDEEEEMPLEEDEEGQNGDETEVPEAVAEDDDLDLDEDEDW